MRRIDILRNPKIWLAEPKALSLKGIASGIFIIALVVTFFFVFFDQVLDFVQGNYQNLEGFMLIPFFIGWAYFSFAWLYHIFTVVEMIDLSSDDIISIHWKWGKQRNYHKSEISDFHYSGIQIGKLKLRFYT